ncbi:hypothetical protein [Nitrosarchaeum sp. AC2]|uniref:hypothetical protein n=1 Tax=Nitrosarchaeum sp. AC2 TaxID=2259673 RepID=UPI0015CE798F|nr:hypothetical protein [Nitrosarchaeum sp. AC2]QLH10210.1 hypothetical protein DSQ20_00825 [Nitrosarchaeum sp. AC2]
MITGSVTGLAYFGAAWSVSTLVIHSGSISSAIYPKLLGGGKSDYLQDNITKILYFAILLAALSITFAKPGLFALNPIYATAALLVLILTMRFILDTINRVFESFVTGIEKVDLNSESTLTNYAKSKLFVIPTFRLVQNGIYLILLVVGFVLLIPNHSEFDLLIYWALLGFFGVIPTTVYLSILMSRSFKIKIDLKSMSKYLIVCITIFGPLFLLTETYLKYNEKLIEFMPELYYLLDLESEDIFC